MVPPVTNVVAAAYGRLLLRRWPRCNCLLTGLRWRRPAA